MSGLRTLIVFLFFLSQIFALEIGGKLNLIDDFLTDENQNKIIDLPQKLGDYFQRATYSDKNYKLEYDITLKLKETTSGGTNFTAEMHFIEQNYQLSFQDKHVSISYNPSEILIFNEFKIHPLTSTFDFYFYMILGTIADSEVEFGGDPYFQKAVRIATDAKLMGNLKGWERRERKVNKILSVDAKTFRQAKVIINNAIQFAKQNDWEQALKSLNSGLRKMKRAARKSGMDELVEKFFNSQYTKIGAAFTECPDKTIFEKLSEIDTVNQLYYQNLIQE